MRRKLSVFISSVLAVIIVLLLINCGGDDPTGSNAKVPILTTAAITEITEATAQCGGNITSDGGSTITARGVCWSINPIPSASDNKSINGIGTGSFSSSITGLSAGTSYYARAYATNSVGTGYGDIVAFTTSTTLPVLSSFDVSEITATTAICGGDITSDGGEIVTARGVCWSTNQTPIVTDNKTTDGAGYGYFISSITGLTANTVYYVRAYATNSVGTGYGLIKSFVTAHETGTVTDIDGNIYQTIKIGDQWWMAENLKVTHYRNGDSLPNIAEAFLWSDLTMLTKGAYCDYNNDINNVSTYGRLYNWYVVADGRNIAPIGWHIPADTEWKILEMYLGISQTEADQTGYRGTDEGGELKESGTTHWRSSDIDVTNESGFSGLPSGCRGYMGNDGDIGYYAYFWSTTAVNSNSAWYRALSHNSLKVYRAYFRMGSGLSIRCTKD